MFEIFSAEKHLNIRKDRTDKTVLSASFIHYTITKKHDLFNTYCRCSKSQRFPPEKCLLKIFECSNRLIWAVTIRIMFLLDQAGNLKMR